MAAIFDVRHTETSASLLVPACLMALKRVISFEIVLLRTFKLAGSVTDSTIERFDPENMGIDTRIMFLPSQIAELLGVCNP